jgi:hypothetical protein
MHLLSIISKVIKNLTLIVPNFDDRKNIFDRSFWGRRAEFEWF